MPSVFSQRGDHSKYPENTLAAFREALRQGADGLFLDVHLTRDHQAVIFQEDTLGRMVDGVGLLRHHTLEEVQSYPFLKSSGAGLHIPSLEEYLDLARDLPHTSILFLRNDLFYYPNLEEEVAALVLGAQLEDRVLLASRRLQSLRVLHGKYPKLKIAWVSDQASEEELASLKELGSKRLILRYAAASESYLERLEEEGLEIYLLDLKDQDQLARLEGHAVQAVIGENIPGLRKALGLPAQAFGPEELAPLDAEEEQAESKEKADSQFQALARRAKELASAKPSKKRGSVFGVLLRMVLCVGIAVALTAIVMKVLKGVLH